MTQTLHRVTKKQPTNTSSVVLWHFCGSVVLGQALLCWSSSVLSAQVKTGQHAPDFTIADVAGHQRSLAEFQGRFVVLEWFNPECPFSKKHYQGNMQRLQRTWTSRGVVWLSIDSSAPGKQGHLTPEQAKTFIASGHVTSTAMLLDPDGTVGRLYGAKTTPHLFIVNPSGVLIYAGAIDDRPSADPADIPRATNYVEQVLDEALAGRAVSIDETKPYGCSVKY